MTPGRYKRESAENFGTLEYLWQLLDVLSLLLYWDKNLVWWPVVSIDTKHLKDRHGGPSKRNGLKRSAV